MKKYIILISLILLSHSIFAQSKELHVEYQFYFKNHFPEVMEMKLVANAIESLSTTIRTIKHKKIGETDSKPTSFLKEYYKTRDSLYYQEEISGTNTVTISEPLKQFNWKLTGKTKMILNYSCQEATTTYRGRDYKAFFTTSIPFRASPWKFHGLPGVVLAVESSDEQMEIGAYSLRIVNSSDNIKNPYFSIDNFLTWDEFVKAYKESWERFKNKARSQISSFNGIKGSLGTSKISPELRLEIIVDGNGGYPSPQKRKF